MSKSLPHLATVSRLGFFSYFMALGSCPTWFVALFITTSLLRLAGYLALRQTDEAERLPPEPQALPRLNGWLQTVWIGVALADLFLRLGFPHAFQYSAAFHLVGYATLAVVQVAVFFRYFLHYRTALFPETRTAAA